MADRGVTHLWSMRALYVVVSGLVMMFHLLPIGQFSQWTFAPDIVLCLTLAWIVRRPEYVPVLIIAMVALLGDLLLMKVPGLWSALVLLLANSIRKQRHRMRSTGFGVEWFRVSLGMAVIFLAERIALSLLFVETPSLSANLSGFLSTVIIYPFVVALSVGVFRVHKPELVETNASGRRV